MLQKFLSAMLRFFVPAETESNALFSAIEAQLRATLGKPKRRSSPAESPSRDWKLSGRTELTLLEMDMRGAGPAARLVEIQIAEPSGD